MKTSSSIVSMVSSAILAMLLGSATGGEPGQINQFTTFVEQHKDELVQVAKGNPAIREFLDKPNGKNDASACELFLNNLFSLSGNEPFIREKLIVGCMIHGLLHPDGNVRSLALRRLTTGDFGLSSPILASECRSYVQQLIAAWPQNGSYELLALIGATHTPEGNAFIRTVPAPGPLLRQGLPEEVRAALGEPGLEESLIKRFQAETNAHAKCELARKLGYVGTTNAVRTLARELRTPLVDETRGLPFPVRTRVLQALGRARPESRLFNEELVAAAGSSREAQETYIGKVERWCEDTLGIQWQTERPKDALSVPLSHGTPVRRGSGVSRGP